MLVPLPHRYTASLCRAPASRARIEAPPYLARHGGPARHGGLAPELVGDIAAWSPEYMLLSSLGLCLLTTFEAFAARERIDLIEWRARVHGTVEQTPEGPMFTSIVLELDIEIAGAVERFEDVLEDAKRYCLVQNALRVPVVIEVELRTPYDAADDVIELRPAMPCDLQRGQLHAS